MHRLSKSQKLVYDMEKFAGGSIAVICGCMLIEGSRDQAELTSAVNELYSLNSALRTRITETPSGAVQTRWGSCLAKKGVITLNKRLIEAPRNCIEYVVMHERCHFVHPNHSKQFYSFLSMLMPDWRERKVTLDKSTAYWL